MNHGVSPPSGRASARTSTDMHFIPSHTDRIRQSDEIDKLAKNAATNGDPIDHDPFVSSYKLILKKYEAMERSSFVYKNVKTSCFRGYPKREPLRDGYGPISSSSGNIDIQINCDYSLLNRVRTGHTRARSHLKNIGIESHDTCRFCDRHSETIEHQLIHCVKFKDKLKRYRNKYRRLVINQFNDALYNHERFMKNFLNAAHRCGCYI